MKVSLLIEARDRASAAFGRIKQSASRMGNGFKVSERSAGRMGLRIGLAGNKIIKVISAADRYVAAFHNTLKKSGTYGRIAKRGFDLAARGAGKLTKKIGGALVNMAKWGALAGVAGAGFFFKGVIEAGITFERFQVILENTEGSAQKAKAAMDWVKKFATTTPFELDKVMESFVALKAFGIDPTNGSLTALGNAASGMGKDIMQAVEMLADAQTGEFERLKEFGIRAAKQGNQVRFTYMRAGKEISKTAKSNGADIQKALIGIFDERFGGMMDRQSRTLAGLWSNIKDMVQNFQLDIANAGIFDKLKSKAEAVLKKMQQWAKDGTLERWAEKISQKMEEMIDWAEKFIKNTDWEAVASDVHGIANAVWEVSKALAAVANAGPNAFAWARKVDAKIGNSMRSIGLDGLAKKYEDAMWVTDKDRKAAGVPTLNENNKAQQKTKPRAGQKTSSVGGEINIKIQTEKGVSAKTTKLASRNNDVPLNVGFVRAAA